MDGVARRSPFGNGYRLLFSRIIASTCGSDLAFSRPVSCSLRTCSNSASGSAASLRISPASLRAATRFSRVVPTSALAVVALPATCTCAFSLLISS